MSDAYDKISKVWSQFPKELENSTLYDDVNKLRNTFENKKHLFGDYLTKIVIIGNVSTGKGTLINALLGKDYFGSITGNGTVSFFSFSLSKKDYEYFTVNNCQIEYKDISILKCATKLNVILPDFINGKSVIKLYIKNDESKLLERETIILDCPGLGHDEICDKEVEKHCSNADLFIFLFQINKPATLNQRNYIKTIRDNYRNPTFFFVYNKCDLPEFNEQMKIILKKDFFELFGEQYFRNLKLNKDPLYFISALKYNEYEDFSRLKIDLIDHKNVNIIRFANVQSMLSNEVINFCDIVDQFAFNERKEKKSMLKSIADMEIQMKFVYEKYSGFLNYVKRRIENCNRNLLIDKIFDIILNVIDDYKGTCYRVDAQEMISKIEEIIRKKVTKFMAKQLKDLCIDPINNQMQDINKDDPTWITMHNFMDYNVPEDLLTIPKFENIKNIFWYFEYGDKTVKVKESYTAFLQSNIIKKQIKESIKDLYKNEFTKIETIYDDLIECSKRKNRNKEQLLNEDLRIMECKLEILTNFEKGVYENVKGFNSSLM